MHTFTLGALIKSKTIFVIMNLGILNAKKNLAKQSKGGVANTLLMDYWFLSCSLTQYVKFVSYNKLCPTIF